MWRDRHAVGAQRAAAARSKNSCRAACAACSIETPAPRAQRRDIDPLDVERHPEVRGEVAAKLLVGVCLGAAQLMVQVRGAGDVKALGLGELAQHEQQRDRIGAAGQSDNHAAPRRKQSIAANRAADGVDDYGALGAWVRQVRKTGGATGAVA